LFEEPNYHPDLITPIGIYIQENGSYECVGNFERYGLNYQNDLRFFLESGVEYFFQFQEYHGPSRYGNNYGVNLLLSCGEPVGNDECISAMEMNCGDAIQINNKHARDDESEVSCGGVAPGNQAIWFTVQGDDTWKNFSITGESGEGPYYSGDNPVQIWGYEGSCDDLSCLYYDNIFYTESGKTYYVSLTSRPPGPGILNIEMTCHETVENDLCQNAISLSCGGSVEGSFKYSQSCDSSDNCTRQSTQERVWFRITGTGDFIRIINETNSNHAELEIYESDCCSKKPIQSIYGSRKDIYFQSEEDKEYLVANYNIFGHLSHDFTLHVECVDEMDYNLCENAPLISNNEELTIIHEDENPINYIGIDDVHFNDMVYWFRFEGSGAIDTLTFTSENRSHISASFFIDHEDCELSKELSYSDSGVHNSRDTFFYTLSTLPGVSYVVAVQQGHHVSEEVSFFKIKLNYGDDDD